MSPDDVMWLNNLATLLATSPVKSQRDGRRAVTLAERAVKLAKGSLADSRVYFELLDTLAAAQAETGDFKAAVATQQEAIEAAPDSRRDDLRTRLKLYEAGKPYRREEMPSDSDAKGPCRTIRMFSS